VRGPARKARPKLLGLTATMLMVCGLVLAAPAAPALADRNQCAPAGLNSATVLPKDLTDNPGVGRDDHDSTPAAEPLSVVVVPQGTRRVLPSLVNQAIALLKGSALVYFLGLVAQQRELFQVGRDLNAQTGNLSPLVAAGLFYLILTIPLTHLVNYIDTRLRRGRASEPDDNADMVASTFGQGIA
jgi:hypothetical protein